MKQLIITVIVVAGIIGGAIVFGKGDSASGEPSNNFYGKEDGIVTVTEYGDFECPACAAFFPIFAQVKEQLKDQVRFEFKHFPLVQIHPNAQAAHRAAEAAAKQGKFWEMHDLLYQRQQIWRSNGSGVANTSPASIFEGYAEELSLDMEKYKADVALSDTLATINADVELGKQAGVSGTPTFFIDGELIETNTIDSVEKFTDVINAKINEKTGNTESESEPTEPTETPEAKPEEQAESAQ